MRDRYHGMRRGEALDLGGLGVAIYHNCASPGPERISSGVDGRRPVSAGPVAEAAVLSAWPVFAAFMGR
jgi:hypothetical protein